ncbi:MAG TPA: aminoglycoside 3'-phosphotransferase/choline kinase family protein [Streptosporangiaceae bacterium]|nr:aminoglycoside 3'-phosphotransferase/choline kinase family protein [Streptosporangiaceae bacterium]
MAVLPPAATEEQFAAISQDQAALRPGVEQLCRLLGIDTDGLTRYQAGSRPVYATGDLVLKLFPPVAAWPGYRIEPQVLAAVAGQLPTPTPQVHAVGEHDGWGYVLMSRLPGVPLDAIWNQVSAQDRDRLADQLGETIAALHRLPPPAIKDWQPDDWPAFVAHQRARCVSEQRTLGLPALWADQIPAFLDAVTLPSSPPVLLHTEVMRQHLLASERPGGDWQLSGLIDFEPAMRGDREYEFVAVGVFVAEGDARFLARTLASYGYPPDQLGRGLRRRLLALSILHRYSNLSWWMERLPQPSAPTLSALADRWFATD